MGVWEYGSLGIWESGSLGIWESGGTVRSSLVLSASGYYMPCFQTTYVANVHDPR